MFGNQLILALGFAVQYVSAASQAPQIPPSKDPWYRAPAGYESKAPGSVLKLRPAPGNLTAAYGNSSSTWNVLFRTTDSNYQPAWAVTTLFVPRLNHTNKDASSLLSYQIPYNTPFVDASPSYVLNDPGYAQQSVGEDIQTLLSYGWFVNVPDHEGPQASFLCSVSEGHATLDSIRAVRSLEADWAPVNGTRIGLWGYSGGSLASEFAAELQVQYAPELGQSLVGMAVGGLPTNATTTVLAASKTYFAGLIPAVLVGVGRQHPEFNGTLFKSLKQSGPYNATTFLSVQNLPIDQIFNDFEYQDMSQYFIDGFDIFQSPSWLKAVNNDAIMGYHGTPQMPMFVYKAVKDELCPIAETDALVERYCGVGANVLYQKNTVGGHLAEDTNGDASALAWLRAVMEGTYNHTGCSIETVAQNVTDSSL